MKNLLGEYNYNIDTKRRFFIPSSLRISKSWVITAGLEECLFLFPEEQWTKIRERIINLPLSKKDARGFLRVFLSRAKNVSCDSQGRILLPELLLKYAGIKNSCTIIGMLNRIELWEPQRWKKYFSTANNRYPDLAENMSEFDF